METTNVELATQQIVSGTVRNIINVFLIERRTRGISKRTIEFYTVELKYFMRFLDSIDVVYMSELIPDTIRKYLLDVSSHRNKGGVLPAFYVK